MRLSIVCVLVVLTAYSQLCSGGGLDAKKISQKIKELIDHGIGGKFNHFFNGVTKFFKDISGKFDIDGTPLTMTFFAEDCEMKMGRKRGLFRVICPADVTEIVTGTKRHCERNSQRSAVECATMLVLEEIKKNIEIGVITDSSL